MYWFKRAFEAFRNKSRRSFTPSITKIICIKNVRALYTVSFDWFLSGLELILNLEYCLLNLLIFYQKLSDLGLTLPHFEFLSLYLNMFDQNLQFLCTKLQFWSNISKYRPKNSKCGRVKPRFDIPKYQAF